MSFHREHMTSSPTLYREDTNSSQTLNREDTGFSQTNLVGKTALISDLDSLPPYRKVFVLVGLCTALFLDTFNTSSLITASPRISAELNIPDSQSVWIFGAYQLAFVALLLMCGRLTDLYNPKWIFVTGAASMGAFALVAGFVRTKLPLLLLRALMGAGGALTIPSSQHLIVHMFPNPESQAKAIALFGGMGGIGLVFGLLIGALFVQFVTWPWVFYFGAIISGSIAIAIVFLVPNVKRSKIRETRVEKIRRFKRLDLFGVAIMTVALILFIFALTSGSSTGWGSARVIAPLVLSVFLAVGFFFWEAYVPEDYAAVPPRIWRYENVTILLTASMIPFMWWGSINPLFSWYWEVIFGWSPVNVALHFLPISLGVIMTVPVATALQSKLRPKPALLIMFTILIIATILLPFLSTKDRYWRIGFPAFLLGTSANAFIYVTINIALLSNTPSEMSGIISALFIGSSQTGAATGLAIVTSIQTSVEARHGGPNSFNGRAAGLWFLLGLISVTAILVLIFMKDTIKPVIAIKLEVLEQNINKQRVALLGEGEREDESTTI